MCAQAARRENGSHCFYCNIITATGFTCLVYVEIYAHSFSHDQILRLFRCHEQVLKHFLIFLVSNRLSMT